MAASAFLAGIGGAAAAAAAGAVSDLKSAVMGGPIPAPNSVAVHATMASPKDASVTLYVILVKWGSKVWTVNRRFSEFEALYDKLSADLQRIPGLPKKAWWGNTNPELIAKRRTELDLWLQTVVKEPYVLNSAHFHAFLQFAENVGAAVLTKHHLPKEITHFEDTQFGVNALAYDDDNTVMFTACGDPNQLSRLDSKLHNMQMPWSKATKGAPQSIVPLGSLSCWKESQSIYKLACTQYSDSEVTCVCWDPQRRYVMIGHDNGKAIVYFINEAFAEFNVVKTISTAHTDRIVAIAYDKTKDVMVTASRDKKICVFSAKNFEMIGSVMTGNAWLSCMSLDSASQRVWVGTYGQQLLAWDLNATGSTNPSLAHTLSGHTGSLRCCHYHAPTKQLFSSGFDAVSGVWAIEPADITKSRSVVMLGGGPAQKIKAIAYYAAAQQVLTGLENGGICIWQTTDGGRLLHVLPAHSDAVMSLDFVEHKRMLVSGARDGKVKLWQFPAVDSGRVDIQPFIAAANRKASAAATTVGSALGAAAAVGAAVGAAAAGVGAGASTSASADAKDKKVAPPLPPLPAAKVGQSSGAPVAAPQPAGAADDNFFGAPAAAPRKPDANAILSELDQG